MLDRQVLVLNKAWIAINVTPARRALSLLFQGHANVVHPQDYALYDFPAWCDLSMSLGNGHPIVRTPSLRIRLPEVIILRIFNGFIRQEVRFSRRNILVRDKHRCQYCGQHPAKKDISIDHVVPRSRGGGDTWHNLVLACMRCNVKKGSRTPEEANMRLLRNPVAPRWLPRFGTPVPMEEVHTWRKFVDTSYWGVD